MTTPALRESVEASRERIIRQLEDGHVEMNRAGHGSPALDEFNAEVIRRISDAVDPVAEVDALVQLMHEHRAGASRV